MIQYDMIQYDVTSVQLLVISLDKFMKPQNMMKKLIACLTGFSRFAFFVRRMHRHGISAEKQPAGCRVLALSLKQGALPGRLCTQP